MTEEVQDGVSVALSTLIALRQAAEKINLLSFLKTRTALLGDHASQLRGRGIDFAETRIYQPGDDIRYIDWRVTARSGKVHTKIFQEERERPVFLLIDYSASMFFGSKVAFKSVIAAKAAAILAWAAIKNGDRVGSILFSGNTTQECRPRAGIKGILPLLKQLAAPKKPPEQQFNAGLATALARLRRVARPGSLIFILSDFVSLDSDAERYLSQLMPHHDITAIHIYDPLEMDPPPPDDYTITNGNKFITFDTNELAFCKNYRHYFADKKRHLYHSMRARKIPVFSISTDMDIIRQLQQSKGHSLTMEKSKQ